MLDWDDLQSFLALSRRGSLSAAAKDEIKRRTEVVGIFPDEAAATGLVGALLLEQSDDQAVQRRYMSLDARVYGRCCNVKPAPRLDPEVRP